jgi:DNA polymerase-3 subunit beta
VKFQIKREALLQALHAVVEIVEKRQTMPIISHLLLKAHGETLTLTSTDQELELCTQASIQPEEEGLATIPARKLFDICRQLPKQSQMSFSLTKERLTLQSGRSRFIFTSFAADKFPHLDEIRSDRKLTVPKQNLRQLLERTHFAMAQQDVRYYLNGLLLEVRSDKLRAVATDGHRLALSDIFQPIEIKEEIQVIAPRKAITELRRLLNDDEDSIEITFSENHLQFNIDQIRFTTKLIDGRFPDYQRVIPENNNKRLTGNRESIYQALTRTAILSNEKFRGVRLRLEGSTLKLQAQNPEREEAEEEMEVDYDGSSLEIGFNVNYLIDALTVMEGKEFIMDMSTSDASSLLWEKGDESSRFVVMPMRL